jgi:membrane-associated protein
MNYYRFLSANVLGALLWGVGITMAGFYAGSIPWVKNISYFLAAFFIIIPIILGFIHHFKKN